MVTFSQKLQQAALNADRKVKSILQKNRRDADRKAKAERATRIASPDGLSKQQRAALQAAEKRMNEDPRAMALVDKAETLRRVQEVRARLKVGTLPAPPGTSVFDSSIETAKPTARQMKTRTVAQILAEKRAAEPVVEAPPEEPREPAPKAKYTPPAQRKKPS